MSILRVVGGQALGENRENSGGLGEQALGENYDNSANRLWVRIVWRIVGGQASGENSESSGGACLKVRIVRGLRGG